MAESIYVSSVAAHGPVSRYTATGVIVGVFIGATRDPQDPKRLVFDENLVVEVPPILPFVKAIRNGSLKQRKKEEFDAQEKALASAVKKAGAALAPAKTSEPEKS